MIYLDTSVVLAALLAEDRRPPETLWRQPLWSSRLLVYELWTRIHARKLSSSHGRLVGALMQRVNLLELSPPVLQRALKPFSHAVRTLDAMHLASLWFLREQQQAVALASYDERLIVAARGMGLPLADLA